MKLFLSSFFIYIYFICSPALGDIFFNKYTIYTSGIKIGALNWEVKIKNNSYSNNISLKSEGFLSALYTFEGNYFSSGKINNKTLAPNNYKHFWQTKKIIKKMNLIFSEDSLKSLEQEPAEKEKLRLDIFNIHKTKDPLTSFLQIIIGAKTSLVVDGRRIYEMNGIYDKNNNQTVIELSKYSNLWADHKESDFEKITFKKNEGELLPSKIFIYFDGRVFKLEQS